MPLITHISKPQPGDWSERPASNKNEKLCNDIKRLFEHDPALNAVNLATYMSGSNTLGDCDFQLLTAAIASNPYVTMLDLGASLRGHPARVPILVDALASNHGLISLHLNNSELDDQAAVQLADAIAVHPSLAELALNGNRIGGKGAEALGRMLSRNHSLTTLDLRNNRIDAHGAKSLASALAQDCRLATLQLGRNAIGDEGARALFNILEKNHYLVSLDLESNLIGRAGLQALAKANAPTCKLSTLNLKCNPIRDEGALTIASALRNNTGLTSLDLSSTSISENGARALMTALTEHPDHSLGTLTLDCNTPIGANCGKELAGLIAQKSTLTTLSLRRCQIDGHAASLLAKELATNTSLVQLDLTGNTIGNEGAKALAEALASNFTLAGLQLDYNKIGNEGAIALATMLERNNSLIHLGLGASLIGAIGAQALAAALKSNSSLNKLDLNFMDIDDKQSQDLIEKSLSVNTNEKGIWQRINAQLEQSRQLVDRRDYRQAYIELSKLLQLSSAQRNNAILASHEHARQLVKQANQLSHKGHVHLLAQRYPEANTAFEQALALCHDHVSARQGLQSLPHTSMPHIPPSEADLTGSPLRFTVGKGTLQRMNRAYCLVDTDAWDNAASQFWGEISALLVKQLDIFDMADLQDVVCPMIQAAIFKEITVKHRQRMVTKPEALLSGDYSRLAGISGQVAALLANLSLDPMHATQPQAPGVDSRIVTRKGLFDLELVVTPSRTESGERCEVRWYLLSDRFTKEDKARYTERGKWLVLDQGGFEVIVQAEIFPR
ncbi:hypothetical protein FNU76_22015 [Chitinimonas arctica]|uniref:Uncharacterized protein n=1 Tax=Chitinimonas arctica TaxID=2594795 RepID=A0A516SKX1_9NEIS|nr:hypothetical protein [Chitinimonas arctica]QDQ28811.1 hypothetical protein FNU76_22015 [Chitinimonas arctica]